MATARESYDAMLRTAIGPWMRTRGFRKTRNAFFREADRNAEVVEFQASQFGTRDHVSFTINLGLVYAELSTDAATDRPARPSMGRACIRERVGMLMGERNDHWWQVADRTDLGHLAAELTSLLDSAALPWLDARRDLDRVVVGLRLDPNFLLPWTTASVAVKLERAGYADLARELAGLPPVEQWRQRGTDSSDER
jgi:hypothetical protein